MRNDESSLLLDRSLRDMLASGDEQSLDNDVNESCEMSNQQRVIELESQLLAATIALEGEQNEVSRLKCHVELLESEYDTQKTELNATKKTLNKHKTDIKQLMRDNDSLRREISRVTGIRKFTDDVPQNNICRVQLDAQTKFSEFREKITNIASSLIEALDCNSEQGPDLVHTTNSRSVSLDKDVSNSTVKTYRQAVLSRSPRNTHATTDQRSAGKRENASRHRPSTTALISNAPPSIPSPIGQPIPAVSLGARRQQAVGTARADVNRGDVSSHPPPNRRQEAASRRPSHSRPVSSRATAVIGTSLINGLGQNLNKLGIPATTFMYRGATVPVLQNRVKHILNCRNQPERIVLQCGGNDAEQQPAIVVSAHIETLVHDIKRLSPGSDILINKIPPRGRNQKVLNNVEKINSAPKRYQNDVVVQIIDICPKAFECYRKDLVHLNSKGSHVFATRLAEQLSNFSWWERKMWI